MSIYVLKSCTGEYEDYSETSLCYFDDINEAEIMYAKGKELLEYLNHRAYEFIEKYSNSDNIFYQEALIKRYLKAIGIDILIEYTGVWLSLEKIESFKSSNLGYLTEVKYKDVI